MPRDVDELGPAAKSSWTRVAEAVGNRDLAAEGETGRSKKMRDSGPIICTEEEENGRSSEDGGRRRANGLGKQDVTGDEAIRTTNESVSCRCVGGCFRSAREEATQAGERGAYLWQA